MKTLQVWLTFLAIVAEIILVYLREKRVQGQLDNASLSRVDHAIDMWNDMHPERVHDDDPNLFGEETGMRDDTKE